MKQIEIAERQVWVHQTTERPEWIIIQPVDDHDLQGLDEEISWISNPCCLPYQRLEFGTVTLEGSCSIWS